LGYKQPTFSIYHLVDKEYQVRQFSGSDRLVSPTFPELILTAKEVFSSSGLFG
jgi:Uma2 family endonuclease